MRDLFGNEIEDPDEYAEFLKKFTTKKTTDDCYTPPAVYSAVRDWLFSERPELADRQIVRPFFPGGDFEKYNYPANCLVLDNPPFSILKKIIHFYEFKGIDYFLFAPHQTLFTSLYRTEATAIVCGDKIIYENGAKVSTSFVTNQFPEIRVMTAPKLLRALKDLHPKGKRRRKVRFDRDKINAARFTEKMREQKISIPKKSASFTSKQSDGTKIFGGGLQLSDEYAEQLGALRDE